MPPYTSTPTGLFPKLLAPPAGQARAAGLHRLNCGSLTPTWEPRIDHNLDLSKADFRDEPVPVCHGHLAGSRSAIPPDCTPLNGGVLWAQNSPLKTPGCVTGGLCMLYPDCSLHESKRKAHFPDAEAADPQRAGGTKEAWVAPPTWKSSNSQCPGDDTAPVSRPP
ncbi:Calpastatin [Manis pentadactyla]|nr:Calpastatin [Manis pentadactyla]